jgi:hypothetical protein
MTSATPESTDRVRNLADQLDCLTEDDFRLLAGITPLTAEAWRKRRHGPEYIRLGNRVLYPRKAVSKYIESISHERVTIGKALL